MSPGSLRVQSLLDLAKRTILDMMTVVVSGEKRGELETLPSYSVFKTPLTIHK